MPWQRLPRASGLEPQSWGWIQFPKKLTPSSPSLAADSSIKGAGFSQFRFLFAFNLVPLLEEILLCSNRKTGVLSSLPLTRS